MTFRHTRVPAIAKPLVTNAAPSVHKVYLCLLGHANNDTNTAILKKRTIETETGLTRRSVMTATAKLTALGLVRKVHRGPYAQAYQLATAELFQSEPVLMMALPTPRDTPERGAKEGQKEGQKRGSGLPPRGATVCPPKVLDLLELDSGSKFVTEGHQRARDVRRAAAANGDTKTNTPNPVTPTTEFAALAELRKAIGASGVLPMATPEAEERVRVWFAAGWTPDTLAEHLSKRLNERVTTNPAGLVRVILRDEPGRPPAAARPVVDEGPQCGDCGESERRCIAANAAASPEHRHEFQAKSGNERAVAKQVPTGSPVRPPDGPAVAELGVLGKQVEELLEQALEGLSPEIQEFARTGQRTG